VSEETFLKFIELFTNWFGQVIALSTGLILVMATLKEKVFVEPRTKIEQVAYRVAFILSIVCAGLTIIFSVSGQFSLFSVLGAAENESARVVVRELLTKSTVWAIRFFAGEILSLFVFTIVAGNLFGRLRQ
jgi:predicted small integral membrane protein